ncbi:ABC transporter substrate-binding protein [Flavonifractor sp. An100]|uniref:ABC transporter substrate-binding protein n=1 Tax=Flavonifractor sp. An100 TaxID=1965538 RepID=UPI001FA832F4|nr:ABC transporter substrate-binding protein [Flavonifractor sp. An100]
MLKKQVFSRAVGLALAVVMAFGCVSCGSQSAGSSSQGSSAGSSASASSASTQQSQKGSIVLTDQAGRQVELEEPAQTVVSCYYISTYAVIALGAADRVVGLEKKADTRPIYSMAAPELLDKPQVGTMKELDVEATAALNPDLVIMPKKLADYADTLTQLGIPVLVVNPESHQELVEMLQLMGTALGVEDRAADLTDYYEEQLERMAQLTDGLEKPVVYMGSNSSYLATAPADMYQSTLIDQAGGVNAAGELEGDYWTEVSYEDVLAMAPEVFVIPARAEYTASDVESDSQLASLPAVANGAVYQMPDGIEEWDSPIPSGILGTMWLTSVLHPEAYPFEEFTADAQAFYQDFYGFTLEESLITK